MFHEYREIMTEMKSENKYFLNMFDKHNALDEKIIEMEKNHVDQFEIEKHKKEKLKIKDDIYQQILEYKKKKNL
jgi:uncharacterized protein YdcH (DUF465 family)